MENYKWFDSDDRQRTIQRKFKNSRKNYIISSIPIHNITKSVHFKKIRLSQGFNVVFKKNTYFFNIELRKWTSN